MGRITYTALLPLWERPQRLGLGKAAPAVEG